MANKISKTPIINNTSKNRIVNLQNKEDVTVYNFGEYTQFSSKWVSFGSDNTYPSYLRNLYLNSPTHQSICDGMTNLSCGDGIEVENADQNPISNKWINDNFPKETVKKLLGDLKIYGYCALQVFDGKLVRYSEAIKYRFSEKCEDGTIDSVWFSNDWDFYQYKKNRPVKIKMFVQGTEEPLSILICQLDKKSFDYYSPTDYCAGVNYIELESQISLYHLSNIKNGLFPSFVINFFSEEFSDEMMQQTEDQINLKFGGSRNTGKAIVGFSANKDMATTIDTITQPDLPATYEFLTKECSDKILISHGAVSPLLFGINRSEGNGLGSNKEEMQQAYYLLYESKLKFFQNYILEMVTKIMNANLLYAPIRFITYNPFAVTNSTETLSKVEALTEVNSQQKLRKIDQNSVKTDDILISESIFDGNLNEKALYKFVKASNNNNIINKKYEILSDQGYLFKPSEEIKNCKDYYFIEQLFLKKTK